MMKPQTVTAPLAIALALGLALAAGSPALAKDRASRSGFGARAEAIGGGGPSEARAGQRASALRECNDRSAAYREYTWGEEQSDHYRACMAGRGQPE